VRRGEQGSSAVLVLMCVPLLVAVLGLVVDLGGKNQENERAAWTAEHAARAAAQQVDLGEVRDGQPSGYDLSAAQDAAQRVLSVAGMSGTISVADGQVTVTARSRYEPKILLVIPRDVTQSATVRVARGIGDQEQP